MIIECIKKTSMYNKDYKVGDQKNVTKEFGEFLIATKKWKFVSATGRTVYEQQLMAEIEAANEVKEEEPKPQPKKTTRSKKSK